MSHRPEALTCAACGIEDWSVQTRIVERQATPDDPTLYAAEPRCVDTYACRDRVESTPQEATP